MNALYHVGNKAKLGNNVKIGFGAYVEDDVVIGNNVIIGPHALIYNGSVIGDSTIIEPYCIIGHPTKMEVQKWDFSTTSPKVKDLIVEKPTTIIGEDSIIRSGTVIYKHVIIGKSLRTGHSALIREHTTIGDEVIIGTHAILDGYIKVGNKSMVQSQCYVAQSVRIGYGVFIAPNCTFLDNKKIILGEGLNGATIEDYVRIGGSTVILPGVRIEKYAVIGAGSVITKSIPSKAIAYGVPAKVKDFQSDEEITAYVESIEAWK
jgi:acetyltransferase-like isoleucine patch superfamily enzyme